MAAEAGAAAAMEAVAVAVVETWRGSVGRGRGGGAARRLRARDVALEHRGVRAVGARAPLDLPALLADLRLLLPRRRVQLHLGEQRSR